MSPNQSRSRTPHGPQTIIAAIAAQSTAAPSS